MANRYDPAAMKQAAERMEQELKRFRTAKNAVISSVSGIQSTAFDSEVGAAFVRIYRQQAQPEMENMEKLLSDFTDLLRACAKKYADAIDNGNAWLSG